MEEKKINDRKREIQPSFKGIREYFIKVGGKLSDRGMDKEVGENALKTK